MDIVFKSYKQTDLAILFLLLFVFTLVMLHSQAAGVRKCTNSQFLHNVTLITTSFLLLGWRSNLHVGRRQKKSLGLLKTSSSSLSDRQYDVTNASIWLIKDAVKATHHIIF